MSAGSAEALALLSATNGTGFQPPASGWPEHCSGPISGLRSADISSVFTDSEPISPAPFPSLSGEVGPAPTSAIWLSRSGEPQLEPLPSLVGEGLNSDDCLSTETDLDFDLFPLGELELERLLLFGDLERLLLRLGDLERCRLPGDLDFERLLRWGDLELRLGDRDLERRLLTGDLDFVRLDRRGDGLFDLLLF